MNLSRATLFFLFTGVAALLVSSVFVALRTEQTYRAITAQPPKAAKPGPQHSPPPSSSAKPKKAKVGAGQPKPYHGDLPSLAGINIRNAVLDSVVQGLDRPWSMEFLSDDRLLIAEAIGRMRILDLDSRESVIIKGVPEIAHHKAQLGLMDVELHPRFADNKLVYFSYAVEEEKNPLHFTTAVSRATLEGDQLVDIEQILVALPAVKTTSNFGGALAFDDAGFLYVGTADRGLNTPSKDPADPNGKILRLTDTGEVPADNPFVGNAEFDDRVYAYGIRNPQGMVFDKISGRLYETEHGPLGGDEINVIEAGKDYGWPTISYGAKYHAQKMGVGAYLEGMEQPLYYYLPSIATSPITIYRGDMFPEWDGDLLVGALRGAHVSKVSVVDGVARSEQRILDELRGRVRDIKVASDGSIYILVQTGGKLYRLYRDVTDESLEQARDRSGLEVYLTICSSCHESGTAGVPQVTDRAVWDTLLQKGLPALYRNAIEGVNTMPAKGLCFNCSDAEIRAAVDTLLDKAGVET